MTLQSSALLVLTALSCTAAAACSSTTATTDDGGAGTGDGGSSGSSTTSSAGSILGSTPPAGVPASDAQTPPTKGADVETWLTAGSYKSWHCESAPHAARSPSPHGMNRVCSNTLSSAYNADAGADASVGERPQGTAAVKEIYDTAGTNIVGFAVYLKGASTTASGANWYWYERVPADSAAPHVASGVVADGFGGSGTPNTICVGCHSAAQSDAAHSPSVGGGDFVYTQVH